MKLTVRERKAAETRLGLLHAALSRLDERSLDQITVKELCADLPVSQPTFFNYFDGKEDLLVYQVQLWSLEMAWLAARQPPDQPLRAIEAIFVATAETVRQHPGVMAEIIAHQARRPAVRPARPVTRAERLLAFPDKPGIVDIDAAGLQDLLPPLVAQAVELGELPADTDRAAVLVALSAIFFGVPIVGRQVDLALVEPAYRRQLSWLWAALRAQG